MFTRFSSYENGFRREWLWKFFLLGMLSFLLLGFFAVRTCIAMFAPQTKEDKDKTDDTSLVHGMVEQDNTTTFST